MMSVLYNTMIGLFAMYVVFTLLGLAISLTFIFLIKMLMKSIKDMDYSFLLVDKL